MGDIVDFMVPTSYFYSVSQLFPYQDLGSAYFGCRMHPQHTFLLSDTTISVAYELFLLGLVSCTTEFSLVNYFCSSWDGT